MLLSRFTLFVFVAMFSLSPVWAGGAASAARTTDISVSEQMAARTQTAERTQEETALAVHQKSTSNKVTVFSSAKNDAVRVYTRHNQTRAPPHYSAPKAAGRATGVTQYAKPIGPKVADNMVAVTRWQNPASEALQNSNWVMMGGKNRWNHILSGKFNPFRKKFHVPFKEGRTFQVPKSSLKYPEGLEKFKGLWPWRQRRFYE